MFGLAKYNWLHYCLQTRRESYQVISQIETLSRCRAMNQAYNLYSDNSGNKTYDLLVAMESGLYELLETELNVARFACLCTLKIRSAYAVKSEFVTSNLTSSGFGVIFLCSWCHHLAWLLYQGVRSKIHQSK